MPGNRRRRRREAPVLTMDVRGVLLYRTPRCWRISVLDQRGGMACGALPDTPPDAPVEVAQDDFLRHLRQFWDFTGELVWQQLRPDSWAADVDESRTEH